MTYNAAQPRHVEHAEERTQRIAKEERRALHEVLKTYEGRRVLWRVLSACGIYESVYRGTPTDTAFRAGRQDLGHQLQAWLLDANDSLYDQMAREARARAKQEESVDRAVQARAGGDEGESDGRTSSPNE
jgi:hypothetical protein